MLNDTCLNQDRYSNNDAREVVTRLALKLGIDENEILKNSLYLYIKKEQLKPLRGIPKAKVKCAVSRVNCVLKKIDSCSSLCF